MRTIIFAFAALAVGAVNGAPVSIDIGRQLFVDDFLIEKMNGVERVWAESEVRFKDFSACGKRKPIELAAEKASWHRCRKAVEKPNAGTLFWNPFKRKWVDSVDGVRAEGFGAVAYESLLVGCDATHLFFSRDGVGWTRGGSSHPSGFPAGDGFCVLDGDEILFALDKLSPKTKCAAFRRDGFAFLRSGAKGVVATKPVVFRGNRLFVNADASKGRILVEFFDLEGRALGFTKGEMSGNSLAREVVFAEGNLDSIAGVPVRLRFTLENASLYSFWTSASRNGASGGYFSAPGLDSVSFRDIAPLYDDPVDQADPFAGVREGKREYSGLYVPRGKVRVVPGGRYSFAGCMLDGFSVLPTGGEEEILKIVPGGPSRISHDREKAEMGFYSVDLLGLEVRAEMSVSANGAIMSFRYPQSARRALTVSMKGPKSSRLEPVGSAALAGESGNFAYIEFSEPIKAVERHGGGSATVEFAPGSSPVVVRCAVSGKDARQAKELFGRELAAFSLREIHDRSRKLWNAQIESGEFKAPSNAPLSPVERKGDWKLFDRRLGMFVHWGIYSVGAWHEQEWMRRRMGYDEYCSFAGKFDASRFDADGLVDVAEKMGAQYIVVTAKHHDGFCMWNTKMTDFGSMHAPSRRDLIGEIAAACRRRGMKLGFYYSNPDWHHPSAYNTLSTHQLVDAQKGHVPDLKHYIRYVREQVRELMTNYGEICCLFWDIPSRIHVPELNGMVRTLQPGIFINDRGWGSDGDYSTPEREVPPGCAFPRLTEACDSIGVQCWGYREDEDYRTLGYLTRAIDKTLSRGGNFLLNIGPKSDGTLPEQGVAIMRRVGEWYGKVKESYRDVETVPGMTEDGAIATKRGKTLYLHYPNGVHSSGLNLTPMKSMPKSVKILNTQTPLRPVLEALPSGFWANRGEVLRLSGVPADELANESVVVRLEF